MLTRNIESSQPLGESREYEERDQMTKLKPKPMPSFPEDVIGTSDDDEDDHLFGWVGFGLHCFWNNSIWASSLSLSDHGTALVQKCLSVLRWTDRVHLYLKLETKTVPCVQPWRISCWQCHKSITFLDSF